MVKNKTNKIFLVIGIIIAILFLMNGGLKKGAISGDETVTRVITPSSQLEPNDVFTISYTLENYDTSGKWGLTVEEAITGTGCTLNGSTSFRGVWLSTDSAPLTLSGTSTQAGTCIISGNYEWGNTSIKNFADSSLVIGQEPQNCTCSQAMKQSKCSNETFADSCGNMTCTGLLNCTTCTPTCDATTKTNTCAGVKFADSCGNATGCTGVKTGGTCGGSCTPSCNLTLAATKCTNQTFADSCGNANMCTGTKNCTVNTQCTCSGQSSICVGTIFNDSCSKPTCEGTKACLGTGTNTTCKFYETKENDECKTNYVVVIGGLLVLGGGIYYFLKKKKVIK